ncbi:MAG: transglutaminase domain-containing protein [Pirellulaceae bacterium]
MFRFVPSRESTLIGVALLLGWLLCVAADAARPEHHAVTAYWIPIDDARGFCEHEGRVVVFDHPRRTLFVSERDGRMSPVESLDGWAVSDVAMVGKTPVYCSRDRVLQVVHGQVKQTKLAGTSDLRSIASDHDTIYLLDNAPTPIILAVHGRTGQVLSRTPYDGFRAVDLAVNHGRLFVLDMGDRCIHEFDIKTGATKLKMQVGPGVSSGCGGICFLGDQLFVHEADSQRLRPIQWRAEPTLVSSWMKPIRMKFVQESTNVSKSETMTMDFDVPLPMRTPSQVVGQVKWSREPSENVFDRFGQSIAVFRDIPLDAGETHELTYEMDVYARAVQYDPPALPLKSLDRIPDEIRQMYLADEPVFQMTTNEMIQAAKEARLGRDGVEPKDVRSLITNIAWHLTDRFRYAMDDTWDDARTSLVRGTGSCSEYSFVFAALCRLNKIPTRLIGGIQLDDYANVHRSETFHRWNEVYFPTLGWIPVDVTKFDDADESRRDFEFLFGTPGYVITLSRGGIDPDQLGMTYYIRRQYRGGKRTRKNYVVFQPIASKTTPLVLLQFP